MDVYFNLLKIILAAAIGIISLPFLIQLMFTTIIYLFGYVYDSICGDYIIKLAYCVTRKYGKLRNRPWFRKLWSWIKPRRTYVRYETPLISYCLSYMAIFMVAHIISVYVSRAVNMTESTLISMAIYVILYFLGMYRRCGGNAGYYTKVLKNNMSFLKLSFWVLGGLMTIIGFVCTILGKNIGDFDSLDVIINNIFTSGVPLFESTELVMIVPMILVSFVSIVVVLYVVSIPVQIVSYFIILLIDYFREHPQGYVELMKRYWERTKRLIR